MTAIRLAISTMLVALPALAQPPYRCGRGHFPPCPSPSRQPSVSLTIAVDPAMPTLPDDTPVGTPIADIIVTLSDGSAFVGSLGFGFPYGSAAGFCALQGRQLLVGAPPPPGPSVQLCTITASTR
jgi:hypothetical protein